MITSRLLRSAAPESGAKATALQTLARLPGVLANRQSSWTAPAKPRGDGAFAWPEQETFDANYANCREWDSEFAVIREIRVKPLFVYLVCFAVN